MENLVRKKKISTNGPLSDSYKAGLAVTLLNMLRSKLAADTADRQDSQDLLKKLETPSGGGWNEGPDGGPDKRPDGKPDPKSMAIAWLRLILHTEVQARALADVENIGHRDSGGNRIKLKHQNMAINQTAPCYSLFETSN
ncbi:hypothetical protein FACS189472_15470 [Alphaproteobacteria bacterium]|nr:hypothetical protein FACS189472_15470 [Alphaproteobacteria bacterium]